MFKTAPLPSSFMLISMFGFILTAFFLNDPLLKDWAWSFMIVFIVMFISSIISISNTPLEPSHLEELAIHKKGHYNRKKK
jgi:hypothetical protein